MTKTDRLIEVSKQARALHDGELKLPTEGEWEYAALGGNANEIYPGGTPVRPIGPTVE